jgi:hypothetical protein
LTSSRQYRIPVSGSLKRVVKANVIQGPANSVIEFGFGAPSGVTAVISNGAFFRLNGTTLSLVVAFNGTEKVVGQGAGPLNSTSYYAFTIFMEDAGAWFVIEDSAGTPVVNLFVPLALTTPWTAAVSHLPLFERVYNSAAVGTAAQLKVAADEASILDEDVGLSSTERAAGMGLSANVNPTTWAQTVQLAAGAAPASTTPTNAAVAYATLGGEFSINITASSENLLGVFGFTILTPYSFVLKRIRIPRPILTTALGATLQIQEWAMMVASSTNPSTATGQRYVLGLFQAAASAAAGTVFNGETIDVYYDPPVVVKPGQILLVLVKIISGSAAGVMRGVCDINGTWE